jgi:hypothetical protein
MEIKRATIFILFCFICLFISITPVTAAEQPMLKKYTGWDYGKTGKGFTGEVPALNGRVNDYDWILFQWSALFNFKDGGSSTIANYDVFNVKKKPGDPDFKQEDGFGLIYKSPDSMADLFNGVWKKRPNEVNQKQMDYYREYFKNRGVDYSFDHPYAYELEYNYEFIRTFAVVSRLGGKFEKVQKSGGKSQNVFEISKWPTIKVTTGNELNIKVNADGYVQRSIKVFALPKGVFPDTSKSVNIKAIATDQENYSATVTANAENIAKVLGNEVDIVLEDGYGRTAIESVKLPNEQPMDYLPTKLTLTEAGQLWVKFKYNGEDFIATDYINQRGMPMIANIKMRGATDAEFTLASMYEAILKAGTIKDKQEFSYMLGKVEIGDAPGKYKIIADVTINNPSHPDRAMESPIKMYNNNTLHGEWEIERTAAANDLVAISVTADPNKINKNSTSTITAQVKNVGTDAQTNVLIKFYDDTKEIYSVRKNMPANKTITVGPFKWTGSTTGKHNISVHVDPTKEKPDKDRSNNIATTGVDVTNSDGSSSGEFGQCTLNESTVKGNWSVTYRLITGYPTKSRTVTWTDSKGKSHSSSESYTDYSDPIWETRTVKYNEQLKVTAEVDTKQNIKTSTKTKASDNESRGSWEIIPYANKNSKNAKEITRAGYGFEVKVKTNYSTDWETKVPKGLENTAKPFGTKYYGPSEMYAHIYRSGKSNQLEKVIKLEKTGGDLNQATWELPLQTIKSESGKVYKDRKYYTSIDAPDGYYTIKISSSPAGMNGLEACVIKKVEIYGSMYDDMQNLKKIE